VVQPYAELIMREERLWIADPKAIYHILDTTYLYQKPRYTREVMEAVVDRGIGSVEGEFPSVYHLL
jgi:hypothetical protein